MSTLILYHANCLDGFGAAYAAWHKFGGEAEYIAVNYGNPPPDVTGKDVYILDFSYPREVLIEMYAKARSLFVLDHHKTAQAALEGLPYAHFDMDKSGCRLAWEYFHKGFEIPTLLKHIEDRDLWRFKYDNTEAVCQALRDTVAMDFEVWDYYVRLQHTKGLLNLTVLGLKLLAIFERELDDLEKFAHPLVFSMADDIMCYTADFSPRTALAVNANAKYASKLGNRLAAKSGTFGATYYYDGASSRWNFSLRSIGDFDVSEIAKYYGGGGHKNAAGFSIESLEAL